MDRSNHYEAAFEAYLQWHRHCYIAVDETRRCFVEDVPVKNLDFIVHGAGGHLLIDIKGRRYPYGTVEKPRRVWECWTKQEDIDGLLRWQSIFGAEFRSLLLFAYVMGAAADLTAEETAETWLWRERRYLFRGVEVAAYQQAMRLRSPRWQTVGLVSEDYQRLARPLAHFMQTATCGSALP